jgi:hypothetical protein
MDNFCNEYMDTRTQFHKKVPAELYDKALRTDLSKKIESVKNNSVQKYMSEIKPKESINHERRD